MTTDARLSYAKAALLQARTLLRDAAHLGTLSPLVRGLALQLANDAEELATYAGGLRVQANRDLDAVRKAKKRRAA